MCNVKQTSNSRIQGNNPQDWREPQRAVSFQQIGSKLQPLWARNEDEDRYFRTNNLEDNRTLQITNMADTGNSAKAMIQKFDTLASDCRTCYSDTDYLKMMRINNEFANFTGSMSDSSAYGRDFCLSCEDTDPGPAEMNIAQHLTQNFSNADTLVFQLCNIITGVPILWRRVQL